MWLLRQISGNQAGKKLIVSLLFAAISVGLTVSQGSAADDGLTLSVAPAQQAGSGKTVQAKMLINAPPALVWNTITNYNALKNILPGYEKSNVIQSSGNSKLLDIAVKVASFLPTYKYKVRVQEEESSYKLSLNRISGDFKSLNATYRLVPQNNGTRTLLVYNLNIDPGFSMPGSLGIIKTNTEKSLKALEHHAEQEAKKSLIGQR
jgi:ribosome-associated toxin RatA of RatAB toxin-antitoxin module